MEFDCEKVLTPFTKDKEKWIGWKGHFSFYFTQLKDKVEADAFPDELIDISAPNFPYKNDRDCYMFFYPVEPPQPKETWRPYKDLTEMIADLGFFPKGENFSVGALARILIGTHFFFGDCIYAPTMIDTLSNSLYMDGWVSMNDLLDAGWMFIDPETDSLKRCGIRETDQEE